MFRLIKGSDRQLQLGPVKAVRKYRVVGGNIFRRCRLSLNYSERCAADAEKWCEKFAPEAKYKASDLFAKLLRAPESHKIEEM